MPQLQQAILQGEFFGLIFGEAEGYLCIARQEPLNKATFREEYFKWPQDRKLLLDAIKRYTPGHNLWYCPHLLSKPERKKDASLDCTCLWADLDNAPYESIEPNPPIVIESSPGRFQSLWPLSDSLPPRVAEEYNKRIAYKYRDLGVDISGWDLTQLLRVPLTRNYKYPANPEVTIIRGNPAKVPVALLSELPSVNGISVNFVDEPENLPDAEEVISNYRNRLPYEFFVLHDKEPEAGTDWSKRLWRLLNMAFEAGMGSEEAFSVAQSATCNKYRRDNRPSLHLWHDVLRAQESVRSSRAILAGYSQEVAVPSLVTDEEIAEIEANPTFIERYIEWATSLGDAAKQYHEASAFILLSAVLSGNLRLETSIGLIVPNVWFLILADTTLTRKTTAMDHAMELLGEIDEDYLLATDGSVEGLLTALSTRYRKPSIFLRDEFTGLMDSMVKKDYMAGMLETLTKLYDAKTLKRVLRKETMTVADPILLIFAGGIKNRMEMILQEEHVTSGFLPRFLIISAESDVGAIRPLGPRSYENLETRQAIRQELARLKNIYSDEAPTLNVGGATVMATPDIFAKPTQEAWDRYNQIEYSIVSAGVKTARPDIYTPIFDRFAKSLLKMAVLIAATRQEPSPDNTIVVEEMDVARAAKFGNKWIHYMLELIRNLGHSTMERTLDRITHLVRNNPGIPRSSLMRNMRLQSYEVDAFVKTLVQRETLREERVGKGMVYYVEET